MSQPSVSYLPSWLRTALIITFVIVAGFVSTVAFFTLEAFFERPFNPLEGAAGPVLGGVDQLPPVLVTEIAGLPAEQQSAAVATSLAQESQINDAERITVLVMGIDRRPGEPFVSRTDTMMVLSVNPQTDQASILSIPRDLYAEIPGWGRDRINTAFVKGAGVDGPRGGAELAMQTVSYNLGIPIDYYLMIDFAAFIQAVDTLGGIDINVPVAIYDPEFPDMNYGYDPLYIQAGQHHFDGQMALKYARTRHQDSDFGRAQRQQQVVLSMRDRVLSLGANELILKLPLLYKKIEDGIRTDLSLGEIVSLATIGATLPRENIRQAVLDYQYLVSYTTPGGASVLVMQNDRVAPLIEELFFDQKP